MHPFSCSDTSISTTTTTGGIDSSPDLRSISRFEQEVHQELLKRFPLLDSDKYSEVICIGLTVGSAFAHSTAALSQSRLTDWYLYSQAAHFGVQSALFNPLHPWLFPELLELHCEDENKWQSAMQRVADTKHPQGLPALIGVPQKHRAWVMKHESWAKVVDWVKQVSEFLTRFKLPARLLGVASI